MFHCLWEFSLKVETNKTANFEFITDNTVVYKVVGYGNFIPQRYGDFVEIERWIVDSNGLKWGFDLVSGQCFNELELEIFDYEDYD